MKYTDLSINLGFHKNMQETNWLKLFPKWWAENDPLLEAIGKEITYIKADGIFQLLNTALKPPVMIWQESINHTKYTESLTIKKEREEEILSELIKLPAPLYKSYGTITLKNNDLNDISNLKISLNNNDYIIILDTISTNDIVTINVGSQKVYINKKEANILINGDGLSYFKTGRNKDNFIPIVTQNIESDKVITYTVTVPKDFHGKIYINNNDKRELYDDFFDNEDVVLNDNNKKRTFYIANTEINRENLNIKLYADETYFDVLIKTQNNKVKQYNSPKPLHNETINLLFDYGNIDKVDMDVDITFDNVVFVNEQNIEVHGLELIPIKSVNLYAYYDFPYNSISTGWRKVYEKEYDPKTSVVYDMITTHFYTKKFYVEVFYENLDHPYRIGFPCEKNAEKDSMYHINEKLDEWGEYLGLKRREYKTNIPDEDYPFTFPPYYPFDIEQDYWYYQRLINEYAWNDLAINEVDLVDTNNNPIVRLHSIDPFVQDFVVYANSTYPTEKENIDYNMFIPTYVTQDVVEADYKRMPYYDTQNLLRYDSNKASVILLNKNEVNITAQRYLSKPLRLWFDLTNLSENIDIKDISLLIEAESTDNNIDKYSNSETGIIIPGYSDTKVFQMTQSENYELEEKEIEYNLTESIDKIQKQYNKVDSNVIQLATIKPFSGRQNTYISIPFILKENDEIVDDITEVYVTYDGYGTYQGVYHNENQKQKSDGTYVTVDEDKKRYIYVYVPQITPNKSNHYIQEYVDENNEKTYFYVTKEETQEIAQEITQEITATISCKTKNHNSFTSQKIPLKVRLTTNTDENEEKTLNFLEIDGPYVDNKIKTIYVEDEWHTGNLRNILQKDGIFFINTYENDSITNTPVILIKNARLKIQYKPKKSTFKIETQILKKDVQAPSIAQLEVKITNTGSMQLMTKVDIVHATNIKIEPNTYIDVNLDIGESQTHTFNIIPEYPILDGQYDILTVCEDKTYYNTITISADGLIQTSVNIGEHYGKYNEMITLKASVNNANNITIDDNISKIIFYIDGFKVGENIVKNNEASIDIIPSQVKYLETGIHSLEARFTGNEKFASSRSRSSLLISQNKTNIDLIAEDTVIYNQQYNIKANVYFINDANQQQNINEGTISFYIDKDKIGTVEVINGEASLNINQIQYLPKTHKITAIYNGTLIYSRTEKEKDFIVVGGKTTTTVFDINAKPSDNVILKARVINAMNLPIQNGAIQFKIIDDEEIIFISDNIELERGIATTEYSINSNILNQNDIKDLTIVATYHDDNNIYQDSSDTGILTIEKGEVIIDNLNIFFGSQYEPLGFYLELKDAKTNEPVTDGQITLSIPAFNITTPAQNIESDGGVRIIHNPVTITADEFSQLLKFYFQLGKTMPYKNANDEIIPLLLDSEETISNFNAENLYRIYDGNLADLNLMDFTIEENDNGSKILKYHIYDPNSNSNADEQIYIGEDGHLYARTNIDPLRTYTKGTFPITINYSSNSKYKSKSKESLIQLNQPAIDIDIHSQKITYGDKSKSIICYVTEYNLGTDQTTTFVNDGNVVFFIDDIKTHTSEIVNGLGVMSANQITNIPYGHHLLMVEYISDNKPITYTYTDIYIEPIISGMNLNLNRQFKGQKSKLTTEIYISDQFDVPITGDVEVYLDGVLIASNYLLGTEDLVGNVSFEHYDQSHLYTILLDFFIDMPNDIDINEHTLTVKYSGDEHILPCEEEIILKEQKLPVSIITKDVYVAEENICHLDLIIEGNDNGIINDGEIILRQGSDNIIARSFVNNNHTTIEWLVTDIANNNPYLYTLTYENGSHYESIQPTEQYVYVIKEKEDVYIIQNENNNEIPYDYDLPIFKTLQEAVQCVKSNGNIHILDSVTIDTNININKDVNIIGTNNSLIFKDISDLLSNEIGTIKFYDFTDFNTQIYEIVGLTQQHLNTTDFHIVDNDLYFVKNNNKIPIFLLQDNKFYSYEKLSLSSIISNVNLTLNGKINISNVKFISLDSENVNDLVINIQNEVNIQKCIIDKTVTISNHGQLKLNTSLVYGKIIGSKQYDLDNNWWGSNEPPTYDINNQIIFKLKTDITPPIIGDDIQIYVELIGENGVQYDLPPLSYRFESEVGYFSIDAGELIENVARTTYFDGTEECTVYCTIDNQTVSLDILSYDRKTEIILDPAIDIPIGYQIPLCAKVQSIADTYYKFDNNGEIIQQSNEINNGVCDFYIDNIKVGRAKVINGKAKLPVYFSEQEYNIVGSNIEQYNLTLRVEYVPDEYYFSSVNKKEITLINQNKVCFVDPTGLDNGDGSFDNPFNSIQQAIVVNKQRIYLKEGIYKDNEIRIYNKPQDIRRYNGECIFKDNGYVVLFRGSNATNLTLTGLTFINNEGSIVFNIPNVTINECIFYKNTFSGMLNNNKDGQIIVKNSVIIPDVNKRIFKNYNDENKQYTMEYCWYGTNTPNEDLYEPVSINKYILMTFESSKEKIYLGSIAHLTAALKYYQNDNIVSLLKNNTLPLRIAKFYTTYGSLMPIQDYTYNNKSITFLNTTEPTNINKIVLTTNNNENYITKPLTLKCNVQNIYGENINSGQVKFKFKYNDEDIILFGDVIDGCATVEYATALNLGEYQLECSYDGNIVISQFKVLKPEIIVSSFDLNDNDNINKMSFNMEVTDSFNSTHINQDVNIFIDNNFITKEKIINNNLNTILTYPYINSGTHTLTITTDNLNSDYTIFTFNKNFIANKKDTRIIFNYSGLTANEPTDLIIQVYDSDNRFVRNGTIDIKYDNETVYVNSKQEYVQEETEYNNIVLNNGVATIYGFYSDENQHSIVIHYSGDESTYNSCLYTNNNFNVGLSEVNIESQELKDQLSVNIGQPFILHFPITDIYNNLVQRGEVNLYLNAPGIALNGDEPLQIKNGYIDFEGSLPAETKAMEYDFIISYNDPSNHYLPTTYYDRLKIHPIKTEILINTIYAIPNNINTIEYSIESEYGAITSGKLEAYYENNLIGWTDISDINKTIDINIPMLSSEQTYNIEFKYTDTNRQKVYEDSTNIVTMIIDKKEVKITPKYTEYYPHKAFDYTIFIKDKNDNNIDFGTIKLYIDNVESGTKQVINGQATIPALYLDTVKEYDFRIVYLENDYYKQTSYSSTFIIDSMHLQDIQLETMHSIPNTTLETTLIINGIDIDSYDGFVDFYIDDEKIGAFSIIDKENQYVKLNIPDIDAGEHQIKFKYYNSTIFKDDEFIHIFNIDEQDIHLSVPNEYHATLNDTISFDTTITEKINGTLEYNLITIENDVSNSRFIGIEQINNRNIIPFEYTLPNNLSQNQDTEYYILVSFTGNNQYVRQEKQFRLYITKMQPTFDSFNSNINVEYGSILTANVQISELANTETIVYFYINSEDNYIGQKKTNDLNDYGIIEFNYELNNQYVPGDYTLIAVIKESTTLEKTREETNFNIVPATPSLNQTIINANIGTSIELPTTISYKGTIIDDGSLSFVGEGLDVNNISPGEVITYDLDFNYEEEKTINVTYVSENPLYNDFEDNITLVLSKNIINFSISNNNAITRNKTIDQEIIINSPTIDNIDNINYNLYLEDTPIVLSDSKIFVPISLPDKEFYILKVEFNGNNIFYPKTQEFKLINQNQENITTDNITLEQAFSLVANYGTINITSDLSDEVIYNNKNVNIIGNNHTLSNCNIINTGILDITDLTFENSTDSVIKNNGELYVHECTFSDNQAQYGAAIYIDNKNINTEITNCTFNHNSASLYGGAIFSNKGNDVTIQYCVFTNQNVANVKGSSIASSGNIYISYNSFFNNNGSVDIYNMNGKLEAENNYFDGHIPSIENKDTTICNLNFWGYNELEDIINNNINIDIDTWLIANYNINYEKTESNTIHKKITGKINQYRNRLEKEILPYKNIITSDNLIPIKINNQNYYLNQEVDSEAQTITLIIGQENIFIEE